MKAVVSVSGLLPLLLLFPTTVPGQDNGLLFQISPREYYALLQLYDQTGGAAWQNNEGWLDPDATQWRGVTYGASITMWTGTSSEEAS